MTRYKMRAECVADVGNFLKVVPTGRVTITPARDANFIPDVTVSFTSPYTLERLRKVITTELGDSHVMAESVALAKDYTGEREPLCYLCGEPSSDGDSRCATCRDAVRKAQAISKRLSDC